MGGSEQKKRSMFPVFMFIGMGIGFLLIDKFGGLGFVASMFIGMGIGFLFDSLFRIEEREVHIEFPIKLSGLIHMTIGAAFIFGGALAIIAPEILLENMKFFIGLGFIAVGVFLLTYGFRVVKAK